MYYIYIYMLYTNPILSLNCRRHNISCRHFLGRQLPRHRGRVGRGHRRVQNRLRAKEGAAVAASVAAAAGEWMAGDSPPGRPWQTMTVPVRLWESNIWVFYGMAG